ncbi:MAG: hypothetical protein IPP15_16975 [Saprospiraceae bacterium]|uniref:Uncharacterized protein n=1 Tax=Candidatus Opimibacter skivensis TaxID=2982028 RepID=A0A9D7T0B3_9BACT|nr:hypothetical protein [Candidatus Opimibacter skivensis]
MLSLLPRSSSLSNPVFATFIYSWQKRFDPEDDPYMREAGEYFDPKTDTRRFFSKEEIDRLNAEEIKEYNLLRDRIEPIELPASKELKFRLSTYDIFLFSIQLGEIMRGLSEYLDSEITFLLDYSIPWLHQKNDFPPVNKALHYLQDQDVSEGFVGGLTGRQ